MLEKLLEIGIKEENIFTNVPMSRYTSFRIGGNCEYLVKIKTKDELKTILQYFNEDKISFVILGSGSNLLVKDNGIKEVVLKIEIDEINIDVNENKIIAQVGAGTKMMKLGHFLMNKGITGFEELTGIPGTIGGAIRMNAGAHKKEMRDIIKSVQTINNFGKEESFNLEQLEFGYRTSRFKRKEHVIVSCTLELNTGNKEEIFKKMQEYTNWRKEKQPLEKFSAGSTFKRGEDFLTAKLIDECGLKGKTIGGAKVSDKHAGFIINENKATAKDVIELCNLVKKEVKNKFDKNIELEIEIIGE